MPDRSELLEALRPEDRDILLSRLRPVRLEAGEVLYEPGDTVEHCYIPRGGAIANSFVLFETGMTVETLMVGREGAIGGIVSNGSVPAYSRSVVMHGGEFYRISLRDLDRAKEASPAVRMLFARYADCMLAQVFQSIACNAVHTIEQRAAKWLIATIERIGRSDVTMTQEQLASMMGIGRSYASRVVQRFKREGLLRTRRGGIEIVDLPGLERHACLCNDTVKRHFQRVLAGVYPSA